VPAAGREVLIQRNANHAFDCTDEVHPDTAAVASLAARVVGLDIAGIDLVCQDISKPLAEQGGAIVEVNAGPSLLMHIKPGIGKPRPVGQAIVDNLFAADQSGRVPLVGVTGTHGKPPLPSWSPTCSTCPAHAGLACSDGIFLGRRQVQKTDAANWEGGRRLLLNRAVEAAVIENGAEVILGEGLAYDRCSVGIVTNIVPGRRRPVALGCPADRRRVLHDAALDLPYPGRCRAAQRPRRAQCRGRAGRRLCRTVRWRGHLLLLRPGQPGAGRPPGRRQARRDGVDNRIVLRTGRDEIRLCRLGDVPLHRQGQASRKTSPTCWPPSPPAGHWA
jgi:cyanophycin synthetase